MGTCCTREDDQILHDSNSRKRDIKSLHLKNQLSGDSRRKRPSLMDQLKASQEVKAYVTVSDRAESQESEEMLNSARPFFNESCSSNLKCLKGHFVRFFPQGYRKLRRDARGEVSQPTFSSFSCAACKQLTVLSGNGYFSCDQLCDFDLCKSCVTCAGDGNMLFESFEVPDQDTIKWQQLQTDDNFFDQKTTKETTEHGAVGLGPLVRSNQSIQMVDQAQPKEKILQASCNRCHRYIEEQEMTTVGYLHCIQCQMFTCRYCAPKPSP